MKRIGVVTVARSDYGIYQPLLRSLQTHPKFELLIIAGGMHLSNKFGYTLNHIIADGYEVAAAVDACVNDDNPVSIARAMGTGLSGFAAAYEKLSPDLVIILGDRYEMCAAALAAVPFNIPLAHIHGGEITEGAMDDAMRHAITKLSHLHFVSLPAYKRRIIQMGEEPWRVTLCGAPALDKVKTEPRYNQAELERKLGIDWHTPPLLVTFHPVTLEYQQTRSQISALLAALDAVKQPVLFTLPNADTCHGIIHTAISTFIQNHEKAWIVDNLRDAYFSVMSYAKAMVGNSSSGIIEAASFGLPVVNIGNRQKGRFHAENVLDVACETDAIAAGILNAISPAFKSMLKTIKNPYYQGGATDIIIDTLAGIAFDERILKKRFHNVTIE